MVWAPVPRFSIALVGKKVFFVFIACICILPAIELKCFQGNCEFLLLSNRVSKFLELLKSQLTRLVPDHPLEVEFDVNPGNNKSKCCKRV